jgi:hypothetical protein
VRHLSRSRIVLPDTCCLPWRCVHSTVIDKRAFKDPGDGAWGAKFIELSMLEGAAAGWLVKDALVFKAVVTVDREDRFQLDTGDLGAGVLPMHARACCSRCLCIARRRWHSLRRDPEAAVRGRGAGRQPNA